MALFECPNCGTRLAYAGKEHPCRKPAKSSDGGMEGHARQDRTTRQWLQDGHAECSNLQSRTEVGIKPGPSEPMIAARTDVLQTVGATVSARGGASKRGRGRPKIAEKRPWEIEGISRATWNRRRQKETK